MANQKARPQRTAVGAPTSREAALSVIFAPLARGDGFRVGAIGAPGTGKTHFMRFVVDEAIRHAVVDIVFSHDVKGREPEFSGTLLHEVGEVAVKVAEAEQTRHLVFRGSPFADEPLDPEIVGRGAQSFARGGMRVLLNIGELDNCLTDGGRSWKAPSVRWISSQGRKLGACLLWTTQQPKRTPDECFDQASTVVFFRTAERSANYLSGTLLLPSDMVAVLPSLQDGHFVLWTPGQPWDGQIYPPV